MMKGLMEYFCSLVQEFIKVDSGLRLLATTRRGADQIHPRLVKQFDFQVELKHANAEDVIQMDNEMLKERSLQLKSFTQRLSSIVIGNTNFSPEKCGLLPIQSLNDDNDWIDQNTKIIMPNVSQLIQLQSLVSFAFLP
eukprot:GDKJ01020890.1.p1 GENE.GDKJ01020890.1~~GDKJ01020890.1.p1  ORF type:complete len:160 (+),score=26.03 GDKJ01020890.1:69-482(+)